MPADLLTNAPDVIPPDTLWGDLRPVIADDDYDTLRLYRMESLTDMAQASMKHSMQYDQSALVSLRSKKHMAIN